MTDNPARTWRRNGLKISMSAFQAAPTSRFSGRRRIWVLLSPFSIYISSNGLRQSIEIPAGFETDFGSVPLLCQLFLGNRDEYAECCTIHDFCCETNVPYFVANAWLRASLFVVGAPWYKQWGYYYPVMIFGYKSPFARLVNRIRNWRKK